MKFFSIAHPGRLLFFAAFCFYCLLSPGNLSGDTEVRWSVCRQFVRTHGFEIEDTVSTRFYAAGIDGKRYSFWGPGQQAILLPFAYIGLFLEKNIGITEHQADLCAQFLAAVFLFPCLGAITVWLLFRLVVLLGYNKKKALITAAIFGFATMHVHYTVFAHEQNQVALLLLVQCWCMVKIFQENRFGHIWLLCAAMGLCLFFRLSSAIETTLMVVGAFFFAVTSQRTCPWYAIVKKWACAFLLGAVPFILALAWYNYIRFGSFFENGYGLASDAMFGGISAFQSNPLESIPAILFSPGKSIFLYNPVLILFVFCFYGFYRRHTPVAVALLAVIIGNILFNSFHTTWAGDYAWSCRYQSAVLPLLAIPIVCFLRFPRRKLIKYFYFSLAILSCVMQVVSVTYSFNLEFVQNPNHGLIPDAYVWKWEESHLVKRFENIALHVLNKREFTTASVMDEDPYLLRTNATAEQVKKAYAVNFFPFKAKAYGLSGGLVYVLMFIWIVLFVFFFFFVMKLRGALAGLQSELAFGPTP